MRADHSYFGIDGVEITGAEFAIPEFFSCVERRTRKSAVKRLSKDKKVSEDDASVCISIAHRLDQLLEHGPVRGNLKISAKGLERFEKLIHLDRTLAARSVGTDTLADIISEMDGA